MCDRDGFTQGVLPARHLYFLQVEFFSCTFPPTLGVLTAQGQFRMHHCDISDLRGLIKVGRTRTDQDVW